MVAMTRISGSGVVFEALLAFEASCAVPVAGASINAMRNAQRHPEKTAAPLKRVLLLMSDLIWSKFETGARAYDAFLEAHNGAFRASAVVDRCA